ncbi:vesicular, overexpressed in cancer, prosurvival protein 1 isoform X2 [Rhinatrema bivittatum]|uniref:vesicular, overexpressed in cancer, prosurvival protein 1 isoform X2 n=1 Tax=Rhinatrema bivittatum TaxID=194408 RepID=UPI0011281F88|nr:vesicular, overexpressed in cancer, prosurvival protein 1 isoform X2 [Rhinatrema bivittatum]
MFFWAFPSSGNLENVLVPEPVLGSNLAERLLVFPGRCRAYEDCCGSRCCVRALSIQRLWYFWFLLMMGVLFCCGAGFFIRRQMYPPPLAEEPTYNVSYTRQPVGPAGSQQPGMQYLSDPFGPMVNPMAPAFHVQPSSPQGNLIYPPLPSYCNTPPPPYEQVVKSSK